MRGFFTTLALSLLLSACSPGSSTTSSGSAGVTGFTAGTTGLNLFAVLSSEEFSIDASGITCTIDPRVDEITLDSFITTDTGTFAITITDTSLLPTNLDRGILFTSYTVAWKGISARAPALSSRTHSQTLSVNLAGGSSATGTAGIIVADLESTKAQFMSRNPTGTPFTYNLTVTYRGVRIDTGETVSVGATTTVEMGNFCPTGTTVPGAEEEVVVDEDPV